MNEEREQMKLDNEFRKENHRRMLEVWGWALISIITIVALIVMLAGQKMGLDADARAWSRTVLTAVGAGVVGFLFGHGKKKKED